MFVASIKKSKPAVVQRKTAATGALSRMPDSSTVKLSRLIRNASVQPKLIIGRPNDHYEREADRIAEQVMLPPAPGPVPIPYPQSGAGGLDSNSPKKVKITGKPPLVPSQVQKQEEEGAILMKGAGSRSTVSAGLSAQIRALRGGGQSLPESDRAFFEPRFGVDFSAVRVHSGGQASELARSVRARAFTTGQDIVFGAGQYALGSAAGRKLLAHELTHVVQQSGGKSGEIQPLSKISATSTNNIQRRRLPKQSELTKLLTGRNRGAHLAGLARLLKRTMATLTTKQRTAIEKKARGKLTRGQFAKLPSRQQYLKLAQAVYDTWSVLRFGDPALAEIGPRNAAERANLKKLVDKTSGYFKLIAAGRFDGSIKKVFASSPKVVTEVKTNYAKAHRQMKRLYRLGKIKTDRSGYTKEVGLGGYANASIIMLSNACFDRPTAKESSITLLHESMHAGNANIGDHVYIESKTTFPKKSLKIKLTNAAHYEVPLRRYLKAAHSYGTSTFIPAGKTVGGVTAAALTPLEKGVGLATNRLRLAWDVGVTLHELYIQAYRQPRLWRARSASLYTGAHRQARFSNCLPYWSKVSRLTIHKRGAIAPRSSNASRQPVTGIDLALSEGVCRKLTQAQNGVPVGAAKAQKFLQSKLNAKGFNQIKGNKYKVRDVLLRMVIRHKSGQITGGILRDMAVVRKLAAAYGNSYSGILTPRRPSQFPYA